VSFGAQTLTFVTISEGALDVNGIPAQVRTEVEVPGCRFRPLRVSEKVGLVENIATEVWQATCPPVDAVLAATAISEIEYDGETYLLVGAVQPFTDFTSTVHKVTVLAQRQSA
jgi:hypothetical protein